MESAKNDTLDLAKIRLTLGQFITLFILAAAFISGVSIQIYKLSVLETKVDSLATSQEVVRLSDRVSALENRQ